MLGYDKFSSVSEEYEDPRLDVEPDSSASLFGVLNVTQVYHELKQSRGTCMTSRQAIYEVN